MFSQTQRIVSKTATKFVTSGFVKTLNDLLEAYHFQPRLDFSTCAISGFHSGDNSDYCVPAYDFV